MAEQEPIPMPRPGQCQACGGATQVGQSTAVGAGGAVRHTPASLVLDVQPTLPRWTGVEARALREARRMSVRAYAAHLGVAVASVSKWEKRGALIRFRTDTLEILDRDLSCAPGDVRQRLAALLTAASP